jgi:hypothetical protein
MSFEFRIVNSQVAQSFPFLETSRDPVGTGLRPLVKEEPQSFRSKLCATRLRLNSTYPGLKREVIERALADRAHIYQTEQRSSEEASAK